MYKQPNDCTHRQKNTKPIYLPGAHADDNLVSGLHYCHDRTICDVEKLGIPF